jgi:diphthamide synthase (EF-2-diphthine--ammonia ligase)
MPLPLVFAWSGGKDSAMALHCLLADPQYRVVSLLTTVTEGVERISMHGVRSELLHRQAQSIGLPVDEVRIPPQ